MEEKHIEEVRGSSDRPKHFAVETGPSREAKDQDPPQPRVLGTAPPTSADGAAPAEPTAAGVSNSAASWFGVLGSDEPPAPPSLQNG
jgi:hypothetical protein